MEKIVKINKNLIRQTLETFGIPTRFELHNDSLSLLRMKMGDFFDPETRKKDLRGSFGNMFGKKVKCNNSLPANIIKFCYLDKKGS